MSYGYNILIFVGLLVSLGSLAMRRRLAASSRVHGGAAGVRPAARCQTWLFAAPPRPDGVALGIVLYCVFVGESASVVRAGIMGILMVLGPAFGRRSMTLNAFALSALVWTTALAQPDGRLHLTFLDVGQGDATLVQTPSGRLVVIDGGPSPTVLNDAVSRSLPFYQRELPLLVLTRASDEKMAGLVSLLERYHVTQLVTAPGAFPKSATALRWRQLLAQQFPATNGQLGAARGRDHLRRREGSGRGSERRHAYALSR